MADLKISQLTPETAASGDEIPVNRAGVNYKITAGDIAALSTPTTAAGSDTQVQFNDGGTAFGGDSGFTYNKTTDTASIGATAVGSYQLTSSGIITESGTTRTLAAGDNGKVIYCTSNSAVTITTATSLGAGFSCVVIQAGDGQVTIAQGSSTTRVGYGALYKTAGKYAAINIICPVANTFIVAGQTA